MPALWERLRAAVVWERLRAAVDCRRVDKNSALLAPMEALLAAELPEGDVWQFEPKWDGFRCLARRDGQEVTLTSKSGKPLARYFPEVVDPLRQAKEKQFLLDGELSAADEAYVEAVGREIRRRAEEISRRRREP